MSVPSPLLEPREFRLLDGLRLNPRRAFAGKVRGERLTRRKGISIEFADYRDYTDGDDLRHLDWNVLARLNTPVMRTYQDEEDLAIHLLLDHSPSMEFGEPTKREVAARIAGAIGYLGLIGGDAVFARRLGDLGRSPSALRGRAGYVRLAAACADDRATTVGLAASLRAFASATVRTGLVVVVSDGLDPDAAAALRILGGRGHDVWFVQVLSDIELDPDLEGDLRLVDAEQGRAVELTANSYALKDYRRRLTEHNASLADAVRRVGGRYALVTTRRTLSEFVRDVLKREGWAV